MTTTTGGDNAATRDDPPVLNDFGLVVRPLMGPGSFNGYSDLANGVETAVGAVAVQVMAANPNPAQTTGARVTAVIQNTGLGNIRVGVLGVTATTGIRLVPGHWVVYDEPDVYPGEIWAIREGAVDSIAFAQEATLP